jgi:hypothetical protein
MGNHGERVGKLPQMQLKVVSLTIVMKYLYKGKGEVVPVHYAMKTYGGVDV